MLSNPQRRSIYDQYGEEGLKEGLCGSAFGGGRGCHFQPRAAEDIFAEVGGGGKGGGGEGAHGGVGVDASVCTCVGGRGKRASRTCAI